MIHKKFELQDFGKLYEQLYEDPLIEICDVTQPEVATPLLNETEPEVVDIDAIVKQAREDGFASCQQKLQPIIDELRTKESLHELLKLKLLEVTSFNIEEEYKQQVSKLIVAIISEIVPKLFLSFPVNFELMFRDRIVDMLNKHHKNGAIKITVHPSKISYIREFVEAAKLSQENKNDENYNIISDEALGNNDCVLEWESNRFEFQVSAVTKEINDILEQFKTIEM